MDACRAMTISIMALTVVASIARSIWFNLSGYSPAFIVGSGDPVVSTGRLAFIVSSVIFFMVFAFFGRKSIGLRTPLFLFAPSLMLMGTGMFALAVNQSLIAPEGMLIAGAILMGLGNAWGTLCTYVLFGATGSLWQVVICLSASSATATIANALIQASEPSGLQIAFAFGSIIVLALALMGAFFLREKIPSPYIPPLTNPDIGHGWSRQRLSSVANTLISGRRQLFQLAIITVAMIALRGSSGGGIWGGQRINGSMFSGSIVLIVGLFLLISLLSFRAYNANPRSVRYHFPLLSLIACFLLLSLLGNSLDGTVRITLNSSIELFCQLIFAFAVIEGMRKLPSLSIAVAGFTSALSWALALVWMMSLEPLDPVANTAIILVTYLLVVLVASPNDGSSPKSTARDNAQTKNSQQKSINPFNDVIEQGKILSKEYRLTRRESDVLEFLVQGRSVPYICKELVLAEGTVRTHMTRIYRKLGIHSKQELFDLLVRQ